jgi:hypothetical protein
MECARQVAGTGEMRGLFRVLVENIMEIKHFGDYTHIILNVVHQLMYI